MNPLDSMKGRDLLCLSDMTASEVRDLLDLAVQMKSGAINRRCVGAYGAPPVLGLLFYKASTRTRVSFTVAMYQLGGQVIDLNPNVTQVARGEPIADTARVLDRYLDVLAVRTFHQSDLEEFARYANIPVINALTDRYHPCQALADLLTIQEAFGQLKGITLTYIGDGNNVAHSLILASALVGMNIHLATPPGFEPDAEVIALANTLAAGSTDIIVTQDVREAAKDSQVLYTDVWASMGQEQESGDRAVVFQPYQVNQALLELADQEAIVLHCLPAHRGEEITDEVMEGARSRIWEQAENRMHAQKALLASVLG